MPNGMGDMGAMGMGMANPLLLQEMMVNNMALMAQMASSMGLLGGPPAGQFPGAPGFPMQGVMPTEMGMYPGGGMNNGFPGPSQHMRGMNTGGRGGRGMGRGRGGRPPSAPKITEEAPVAPVSQPVIAAPVPTPAPALPSNATPSINSTTPTRSGFVPPERPQSPTLCKFGLKCTNAHCRFSHPSPVATAESGVVLSNEACEQGKNCKDKDCIKAHISPAALITPGNSQSFLLTGTFLHPGVPAISETQQQQPQQQQQQPASTTHGVVACRFGSACTRPHCTFAHPTPRAFEHHGAQAQSQSHFAQQCRFGAGCTRATCAFQHPPGRVLPSAFHRGLSTSAPLVNVPTPEAGSMGPGAGGGMGMALGASPHRSVTFNHGASGAAAAAGPAKGGVKELERRVREAEERKSEAEKAVKEAEAAAANKKDESKVVAITA